MRRRVPSSTGPLLSCRITTAAAKAANAVKPNVRLIDPVKIQASFTNKQQSRAYYNFADPLDIDRYQVDGNELVGAAQEEIDRVQAMGGLQDALQAIAQPGTGRQAGDSLTQGRTADTELSRQLLLGSEPLTRTKAADRDVAADLEGDLLARVSPLRLEPLRHFRLDRHPPTSDSWDPPPVMAMT